MKSTTCWIYWSSFERIGQRIRIHPGNPSAPHRHIAATRARQHFPGVRFTTLEGMGSLPRLSRGNYPLPPRLDGSPRRPDRHNQRNNIRGLPLSRLSNSPCGVCSQRFDVHVWGKHDVGARMGNAVSPFSLHGCRCGLGSGEYGKR